MFMPLTVIVWMLIMREKTKIIKIHRRTAKFAACGVFLLVGGFYLV